ncbi:hypothetical protein ACTOWA_00480 [Herbaspirillum seropedicae]|uniref:hypothetical protein n=1 Tax=Herbaspirillum seropedicae TaxID=964 RepID=UPI0028667827|nr:hypothetical protein [Herbaspirillum seropedicae]MDR6397931.1 hypothetical protein [Herbaspirillum seropedicae]
MKQKNRKLFVAFAKGAAYLLGWLAGIAGCVLLAGLLVRFGIAGLRLAAGNPNCSLDKPACAVLPTTFDHLYFWAVVVICFLGAAAYQGYTRFYSPPAKKRDTWPWPQD